MEAAEKMAADIALTMNGGEWKDGKWYSKGHREAWIKAVQPYADEIEQLREDLDLIKKMARAEIDAKLRYAAALRNIADIEHEDLAAPKSPAEAVLWVCLDRCVTLAENALKWKE